MSETIISEFPPRDGREWDCQCARCGGSCEWHDCEEWDCEDGFGESDFGDDDGTTFFCGKEFQGMTESLLECLRQAMAARKATP